VLLALPIIWNSSARAEPLAPSERAYVILVTMSLGVTNMCEGYDVDDTKVLNFAGVRRVDIHKLGPATLNAIEAIIGAGYDRSALMPEVTLIV
jgi:hypothetical protein